MFSRGRSITPILPPWSTPSVRSPRIGRPCPAQKSAHVRRALRGKALCENLTMVRCRSRHSEGRDEPFQSVREKEIEGRSNRSGFVTACDKTDPVLSPIVTIPSEREPTTTVKHTNIGIDHYRIFRPELRSHKTGYKKLKLNHYHSSIKTKNIINIKCNTRYV